MKMSSALCLGLFLAAGCVSAATDLASPSAPPFDLALSVNDSLSTTIYRGWPLILRGDAFLLEEASASCPLAVASLSVAITPSQGAATSWPLRRMTDMAPVPSLGPDHEAVRVVWLLTPEQSASLAPGTYTATLAWAGRESPPLKIIVADAPAVPSPADEERRAILQSEAALLLGDATAALQTLESVGTKHPDSITLLVQRARVLQQRGDFAGALNATQRAQEVFRRDFPKADEPPVSILALQSQVMAAMIKAMPAATTGGPTPAPVIAAPAPRAPKPAAASALPANLPSANAKPAVPTPPAKPVVLPGEPDYALDPHGQWATTAEASSQYGSGRYSASQATGVPNAPSSGDHWEAWTSKTMDGGEEWLMLHFATPVHATEIRVRQSFNPGAMVKVEVLDAEGHPTTVWSGRDTTKYDKNRVGWFVAKFAATAKPVNAVRLTLDTGSVKGWNAIDAVQLVGDP